MAKKITLNTFLFATLFLLILFQVAFNWGYSNVLQTASASSQGLISPENYQFSVVDYQMVKNDPTLLFGVEILVQNSNTFSATTNIDISVDNGLTWTNCDLQNSGTWNCTFISGFEPNISDVVTIQMQASN